MPITKGFRALVDEALAEVRTVSVDDVLARRDDPNLVLLDIRDVRELQAEGTVPGSSHMPRCMLEFWVDPDSPYFRRVFADESKEFVLFCNLGWRSALAAKSLQDMGMTNVANMHGGFTEWVEKGGPTETMEERKAKKAK
jgi:rhodanese-related sulfurtransferase